METNSVNSFSRASIFALAVLADAAQLRPPAVAADRVYWTDSDAQKVSFTNLDGTGGAGDLNTAGATATDATGAAIDVVAGRIYWTNRAVVSFANLDGTGGADLNPAGATVNGAWGIALDRIAGRLYWANQNGNNISLFSLHGAGGSDLNTSGVTVNSPVGVALDLAAGRIYWGNGNGIAFARLDGTGGGNLNTTGATIANPEGLAIDPVAGRVYWANFDAGKLSFAALDGSGGADLAITGVPVTGPVGVAIDPDARRIYWADYGSPRIAFANLDGSGGTELDTSGATVGSPGHPALLQAPRGTGAPAVTGGAEPGTVLTCSDGSWAPDLPGSFVYRAPGRLAHQWSLNGTDIAGATASVLTAFAAGEYRCAVTASNFAGTTMQASAPHAVIGPRTECEVPNVVGLTLPEASATLEAAGCAAGKVKRVPARGARKGRITAQRPAAGARLPLDGKVNLKLGRGRPR